MKTRYKVLIWILIAAVSFLAGSWVTFHGSKNKSTAERRILYYVDPMNRAHKSDKPGIAPCGMPFEPVYAGQGDSAAGGADARASMPSGTIRISPEKQQLIGVKTTTVEKAPWSHTTRVLGRITPDETLVYRINAAVNGWIEDALPVTTGSMVKANEILATFYSPEYRNLVQNYYNLININKAGSPGAKAVTRSSQLSVGQLKQLRDAARDTGQAGESAQLDYYRKSLYSFGMSAYQVEEMERTRTIPNVVEIRAPIAGFVLYRNVSPGLFFDRGTEFFRIADLSRVWILADIFENEAAYFKPGMRVKMELPYQKKIIYAQVSPVLPQFDAVTRTLKVRLAADNPGYAMRPDMFVNVELPVSGPPAIIVPMDAVIDSGLKKTVFVDRGNGFFEPRQVEAGRSLGERVEIIRGLMPGEKIVVSGNFLMDSEARMQRADAGITGKVARDPICGMNIDEDRARAEGNFVEYRGRTYFFCDPKERDDFRKEPDRYLKASRLPMSPDGK
jgi:Cu(I)/Ag(I) efflux system membrane fusion protein